MDLIQIIKPIKLLILDVDGVMTDGIIYYTSEDLELRGFNVQDGIGIKLLHMAGIDVAVISAKDSQSTLKRLQDLNIKHIYLGANNKVKAFKLLKEKLRLAATEIAFMGDDLPDLAVMQSVRFKITVPHAPDILKQHADYITKKEGGHGAVREVCELILKTQEKYSSVVECYTKF